MGIQREFEQEYELARDGEAFVTGDHPRRDLQDNPEVANDISGTGLSGEFGGMDDVLVSETSSAELDRDVADFAVGAHGETVRGDLTQIQKGMKVFDADGDEIGKVDFVHFGDPEAATTEGEEIDTDPDVLVVGGVGSGSGGAGLGGFAVAPFGRGDLDVPEPMRSQLIRTGFVQIDSKGWFTADRYAPLDAVATVSADGVRLRLDKDDLITGD